MKKNESYNIFLQMLDQLVSDKKQLAIIIKELLHIEKEAVYRRLRGVVPFSFPEITVIAQYFGISLDNIMLLGNGLSKAKPCRLNTIDYQNLDDLDYRILDSYMDVIKAIPESPESEVINIGNNIPQLFYIRYPHIYKYYLFKASFLHNNGSLKIPLSQIKTEERLLQINKLHFELLEQAKENIIIWDKNIIPFLIKDIKHFHEINLISSVERKQLKEDLIQLIKEIEQITQYGRFIHGNTVKFYISDLSIQNDQVQISINNHYKLSMLMWFTLSEVCSTDETTYNQINSVITSIQRSSTLISESGEKERIMFFHEQMQHINTL